MLTHVLQEGLGFGLQQRVRVKDRVIWRISFRVRVEGNVRVRVYRKCYVWGYKEG